MQDTSPMLCDECETSRINIARIKQINARLSREINELTNKIIQDGTTIRFLHDEVLDKKNTIKQLRIKQKTMTIDRAESPIESLEQVPECLTNTRLSNEIKELNNKIIQNGDTIKLLHDELLDQKNIIKQLTTSLLLEQVENLSLEQVVVREDEGHYQCLCNPPRRH